jgi:hypothetical protein
MIVAAAEEVVPMTKQIGCAVVLGHTIWVKAVTVRVVSLVQVTVDPEIVAVSKTPFDEVPEPMATHAGVVAPEGHTMLVSSDTPVGSALFVHVVPLVDTAAAPPDELYPTAIHALVVQSTPSIPVMVDGKDATDQPELVFARPSATGDTLGEVALVAV